MKPPVDDATVKEMRRLLKVRGESPRTVGERFGLTAAEVFRACDRRVGELARAAAKNAAKGKARAARSKAAASRARREAARDAEIRRLWSEGTTGRALAARFGMAPSKVSGIVAGLPRPVRYAGPEATPRLPPLPKPAIPPTPPDPADRLACGPTVRGSRHGRALLDEAKVIEMRRLRSQGWSTGRLATRYGVSRNTVCYAINGRTWGHVAAEPATGGGVGC
jgi:hypothetical protein